MDKFYDRNDAGRYLVSKLQEYKSLPDTIVLGLPRGGVPVAFVIATELSLPLDVFLVRKLGVPGHGELAMGAIASGGVVYYNESLISQLHISQEAINDVIALETKELERRVTAYRGNKPFPELKNQTVILVDDGIATGATIRAAIEAIRVQKPKAIIVAVPVAAQSTLDEIEPEVDKVVCPLAPVNFYAVGLWYENFSQTSDDEVRDLLARASAKLND